MGRLAADQHARAQQFGPCRLADRTAGTVRLQRCRLGGTEFAVDLGLDEQDLVAAERGIVAGGAHASPSAIAACASIRRARHSRDITVPIGVCVVSAISL